MPPATPSFYVLLENIRSAYNVGSIFRTCDSAGVDHLLLTGYTAIPPHPKLSKTALGSTTSVKWTHHCSGPLAVKHLKSQGISLISFEPLPHATSLFAYQYPRPACLIFGHEESGISPELLALSDQIIQIPHFGIKDSLNVASAAAIAIYEFKRQLTRLQ